MKQEKRVMIWQRRCLALLLVLVMALSMVPTAAFATEPVTGESTGERLTETPAATEAPTAEVPTEQPTAETPTEVPAEPATEAPTEPAPLPDTETETAQRTDAANSAQQLEIVIHVPDRLVLVPLDRDGEELTGAQVTNGSYQTAAAAEDVLCFRIYGNPKWLSEDAEPETEPENLLGYYEPTPESLGALVRVEDESEDQSRDARRQLYTLTLTGDDATNHDITLEPQSVDYTVTFHDVLSTDPAETRTYNCETEETPVLTVPDGPAHNGYTFVDWVLSDDEDEVNSDCEVFDPAALTAASQENVDVFALYRVDGSLTITGKTGRSDYPFTNGTGAWTNQDVTLTMALDNENVSSYDVTGQLGTDEPVTAAGPADRTLTAQPGQSAATQVKALSAQVTKTLTLGEDEEEQVTIRHTFTTAEAAKTTVTVRQDTQKPVATLSRKIAGTDADWTDVNTAPQVNKTDAVVDNTKYKVTFAESASGSPIDTGTLGRKNFPAADVTGKSQQELSELMAGVTDWTTPLPAGEFQANDYGETVMVVKVADEAGNVRYLDASGALFDNQAPEVTVRFYYFDSTGNQNVSGQDNVFAENEIIAAIEVRDDHLSTEPVPLTVTVNGEERETTLTYGEFTKKWTAEVPLTQPGRNTLSVPLIADASGNLSAAVAGHPDMSYFTERLYIDTTPEITSAVNDHGTTRSVDGDSRVYLGAGGALTLTARSAVLTGGSFNMVVRDGDTTLLDTDNLTACTLTDKPSVPTVAAGSYACTIADTDLSEGAHTVTVSVTNSFGKTASERYTVIVDKTAPRVRYTYTALNADNSPANRLDLTDPAALKTSGRVKVEVIVSDDNLWLSADDDANLRLTLTEPGDKGSAVLTDSFDSDGFNPDRTSWTHTYTLTPDDYGNGRYQILAEVTDAAGNAAGTGKDSILLDLDNTAPEVLTGTLALRNDSAGEKMLNLLTFGNFFNAEAVLTFTLKDPNAPGCAGIERVELVMDEGNVRRVLTLPAKVRDGLTALSRIETKAENVTEVTQVYVQAADDSGERITYTVDGSGVLTVTCVLPMEGLSTDCWRREITLTAVDALGNRAEVPLMASDDTAGGPLRSSLVHYETDAPRTALRVGEQDYTEALYKVQQDGADTFWFRETDTLTVHAWDDGDHTDAAKVRSSGMNHFKVIDDADHSTDDAAWLNKTLPYIAQSNTEPVYADSQQITAAGLRAGANTLTVTARDNAGNESVDTYTIYKDAAKPTCTFTMEQAEDESELWLKQGSAVTVTVRDDTDGADANAGLKQVTITRNGTVSVDTLGAAKTCEQSYTFGWNDLRDGRNEITVKAEDGVGHTCEETRVIYKDSKTPEVTAVSIAGLQAVRSYGNFTNQDVKVTVTVDDVQSVDGGKLSSGLSAAELVYTGGKGCTKTLQVLKDCTAKTADAETLVLTATIPVQEVVNTTGALAIRLTDKAGNRGEYQTLADFGTVTAGGEHVSVNKFTFERQAPTLTPTFNKSVYTDSKNRLWYAGRDVQITYTMEDGRSPSSGLRAVQVKVNGKAPATELNTNLLGLGKPATLDTILVDLESSAWANAVQPGENRIQLTLTDDAGNRVERTDTVCLDLKDPQVTDFAFSRENKSGADEGKSVEVTDYGYFFSAPTRLIVDVKDDAASSGIAKVLLYRVDNTGKLVKKEEVKVERSAPSLTESVTKTVKFLIPSGFKGQLYVCAVDNAGRVQSIGEQTFAGVPGKWVHPDGIRVETANEHRQAGEHIKFELQGKPESYLGKNKTNPLFKTDAKLRVTVTDDVAGIKQIEYSISAKYDKSKNRNGEWSVVYTQRGEKDKGDAPLSGTVNNKDGWECPAEGRDANLYTVLTKTFTISHNSNDIAVKVKLTDNCDNVTEQTYTLSIDKNAPVVSVRFSPDDGGDDEKYVGYFHSARTVTVKVKERNFDPSKVKFAATRDKSPMNISASFDKGKQVVEQGIEYRVYTMTYQFSAADAEFTFGVSATDKANNATADAKVDYGAATAKQVAKHFFIDTTPPVVDMQLVGEEGEPGYFKDKVLVQVTIVEHNFDRTRVEPGVTAVNALTGQALTELPEFKFDGPDGLSGTYLFETDGKYQLSAFKVTDKAGNQVTCTGQPFYVDTEEPKVEFFTDETKQVTLDKASTNDAAVPYFEATDANYDSMEYTLTRYRRDGDVTESHPSVRGEIAHGESVRFEDFPRLENEDDIYVITATVKDKAGREATQTATFSVNRFGSTYMLDGPTRALIGKYYINSELPVTIVEINASEMDKVQVATSRNGETRVLVENADYTVTKSDPLKSDDKGFRTGSHWYEYTYTVSDSNYVQEGRYLTDIYTVDYGTNEQSNVTSRHDTNLFLNDYENKKVKLYEGDRANAPVEFIVDKTEPKLSIAPVDAHTFATAMDVTIHCEDETALDRVDLYLNDVLVDCVTADRLRDGSFTYTVSERGEKQHLKAVAFDMAGNDVTVDSGSFVVTSSPWVMFTHNAAAVALVLVILGALGAVIVLVLRRIRDNEYV